MKNIDLNQLGKDLEEQNHKIFQLYQDRQETITKIQKVKIDHELPSWDPQREYQLFSSLNGLLEDKELSFYGHFSLLIESQASLKSEYPKWSEGVHLSENTGGLEQYINPVLLFVVNKTKYLQLKLKEHLFRRYFFLL